MLDITLGALKITAEAVKTLTWCVVAGVIIASVVIFFNKTVLGTLVRALLEGGAIGEENAKTLDELGVVDKESAMSSLKRSETIKKIVKTSTEQPDDNTRLYIPEDQKDRAEHQFGLRGNELIVIILTAVFFVAVGIFVTLIF